MGTPCFEGVDDPEAQYGPRGLPAPCGCKMLVAALKRSDHDRAKAKAIEEAELFRRAWNCPFAGNPEPRGELPALPPEHLLHTRRAAVRSSLLQVYGLTGHEAHTCPRWYVRQDWVQEAASVYRWREKNGVQAVLAKLSHKMMAAVDVIHDAVIAEQSANFKAMKQKR